MLLKGRGNSESTADLSIGFFPFFSGQTDIILHINESIEIVDRIEFLLLFFRFGSTF